MSDNASAVATEPTEQPDESSADFWGDTEDLETEETDAAGPSDSQDDAPSSPEIASADEVPSASGDKADTSAGAQPAQETAPASPGQSPKPQAQPFRFKLDGEEHAPRGAVTDGKGIYFTNETWQKEVLPRIRSRTSAHREIEGLRRQVEERDPEKNADVAQARELLRQLDGLFGEPDDGRFLQRAAEIRAEWAISREKARSKALEERLDQITKTGAQEQEHEQIEAAKPVFRQTLTNYVDQFLEHPDFKGLGLNRDKLVERFWKLGGEVFFQADRDYPEYGIARGEYGVRLEFMREMLDEYAEPARNARKDRERQNTAARNDAALGRNDRRPPPSVGVKGAPTGSGEQKKTFKNKQEYDDYMARLRSGEADL